jgi:hypothetical protein
VKARVWGVLTKTTDKRKSDVHSAGQRDLGRRSSSTLNENAGQVASSKLPPAAEKTEKLRGALIPNASVIDRPNVIIATSSSPRSRQSTSGRCERRIAVQAESPARIRVQGPGVDLELLKITRQAVGRE